MNIEKFRMEKKIILLSAVLIALLLKLEKLYKKMWQKKQIFLVSILFKKLREEKGWGGGWLSERRRIFEKNIPGNGGMIYLMLMPSFILVPSGLGNTFSHS